MQQSAFSATARCILHGTKSACFAVDNIATDNTFVCVSDTAACFLFLVTDTAYSSGIHRTEKKVRILVQNWGGALSKVPESKRCIYIYATCAWKKKLQLRFPQNIYHSHENKIRIHITGIRLQKGKELIERGDSEICGVPRTPVVRTPHCSLLWGI